MATKDAVKQYTNGRGDLRVSILTNPLAVEQLLAKGVDPEHEPELAELVAKLQKAGLNAPVLA